MMPIPFSKEWREMLIRQHSKARLVRRAGIPVASEKVYPLPINPLTNVQGWSRQLTDEDVMERQVRRLLAA